MILKSDFGRNVEEIRRETVRAMVVNRTTAVINQERSYTQSLNPNIFMVSFILVSFSSTIAFKSLETGYKTDMDIATPKIQKYALKKERTPNNKKYMT